MAKWLQRVEFVVPACITFGPLGVFEKFQFGLWLLIAGLLWVWLTVHGQRREIAALTARLAALQETPSPREPGA